MVTPMKTMLLLSVMAALSVCIPFVHAVGGQWYLLTPKMILRMNLTDTPYVASIGVRNTDNESVDIVIDPPASLGGVVFFNESELNFTLSSGEERWVNFTVDPGEAGTYQGDVLVLFTSQEPNVTNAALASEVMIIATGETVDGGAGGGTGFEGLYPAAILAAVAIMVLMWLLLGKRLGKR
jgi:hypothetical protein